jgi:hypothetical protein
VVILLANLNLLSCDFAIGKSINETTHALQTTPLGLTVNFHALDLPFEIEINFLFGEIASSISLASIFDDDRVFARVTVHQGLVLITFGLFRVIRTLLPLALLHFIVVVLLGHLASIFCFEVLVKHSICKASTPTTRARLSPSRSVDMATTECDGQAGDVAKHTLTTVFPDDDSIVLLCAPLLGNGGERIALQVLDLKQRFLLHPASSE